MGFCPGKNKLGVNCKATAFSCFFVPSSSNVKTSLLPFNPIVMNLSIHIHWIPSHL